MMARKLKGCNDDLQDMFNAFDTAGKGVINMEELIYVIKNLSEEINFKKAQTFLFLFRTISGLFNYPKDVPFFVLVIFRILSENVMSETVSVCSFVPKKYGCPE